MDASGGRLGTMRVLVTGATGFLGGRVAERLSADHQVIGIGRAVDNRQSELLRGLGVRMVRHDLNHRTRRSQLDVLLDEVDAVVHCAALSTLWGRWSDLYRTNVEASEHLAEHAAHRGLRLVHISSPSVVNREVFRRRAAGDDIGTATHPVPEDLRLGRKFDSDYARSKFLAENAVRHAHPHAVLLRPRGIVGPGDTSILPKVVDALRAGRLPRLVRHEVWTDLTHVDNAAHAVELALTKGITGVVNISDGEPTPIWGTIDRIADALGVPRPKLPVPAPVAERAAGGVEFVARHLPGRPEPRLTATSVRLLTRGMRLDLTRARTEMGYTPVVTNTADALVALARDAR